MPDPVLIPTPTGAAGPHDGLTPYAATSIVVFNCLNTRAPRSAFANVSNAGETYIRVYDANGPLAGEIVTCTSPGSGASVRWDTLNTTWTITTDADGFARIGATNFLYTSNVAGVFEILVSPNSNTGISASVKSTNTDSATPVVCGLVETNFNRNWDITLSFNQTSNQAMFGTVYSQVKNTTLASFAMTAELVNPPAGTTFSDNSTLVNFLTGAGGAYTAPAVKSGATAGSCEVWVYAQGDRDGPRAVQYVKIANSTVPAALVKVSGDGQGADIGIAFPAALVAQINNNGGFPLSGVTITFTAPASGASCQFSGSNVFAGVSGVDGRVTTPIPIANGTVGAYVVAVSSPGVSNVSFSLTNSQPSGPVNREDGLTFCEV